MDSSCFTDLEKEVTSLNFSLWSSTRGDGEAEISSQFTKNEKLLICTMRNPFTLILIVSINQEHTPSCQRTLSIPKLKIVFPIQSMELRFD